jgi:hypothetical protein
MAPYRPQQDILGRVTLFVFLALVASGCAVGNRYSYRDVVASVPVAKGRSVAVATHDQRPYIVAGEKQPNFVGIQRGGFGNPFNVSNRHNEPLSTSYSIAVCNSLKAAGATCAVVETNHLDPSSTVTAKLTNSGKERALLFTLREWKTDALLSTALIYDVTLDVISPDGRIVASKVVRGKDDLDGSFWNGPRHARKATPVAFKAKLESMIGSPEIQAALAGGGATFVPAVYEGKKQVASSAPKIVEPISDDSPRGVAAVSRAKRPSAQAASCTVAQILEMKKIGLTDEQIERSCQ